MPARLTPSCSRATANGTDPAVTVLARPPEVPRRRQATQEQHKLDEQDEDEVFDDEAVDNL